MLITRLGLKDNFGKQVPVWSAIICDTACRLHSSRSHVCRTDIPFAPAAAPGSAGDSLAVSTMYCQDFLSADLQSCSGLGGAPQHRISALLHSCCRQHNMRRGTLLLLPSVDCHGKLRADTRDHPGVFIWDTMEPSWLNGSRHLGNGRSFGCHPGFQVCLWKHTN